MSRISNQLIGAVATWHDIHTSLMKVGLSSDNVSSDEVTKAPFNSSSSASSSYSTDSLISFIGNDSLSGNQSSDENLDDEKLFNYHSRLSISNMELRNSQLKEIFPRLSEHWRYSSNKLTLSRTCFSIDHSDNLLPSNTQKKPMLIRAETIDLPDTFESSDNCAVNANSRMKHDVRPHLLVSFFAKHFEKMHKRMTKRPLGSSLSFDLDERQRMNALQHRRDSQDKGIIPLPATVKLHVRLNCFHCLFDASLRERKLNKLENGIRLRSSSDTSDAHYTNSRQHSSQKFNTNCKASYHGSIHITNK
ncbi:unnamed protein product [Acanthocheilonema viteae]|uniref:Uncharacterized protein n=1 Tax=Acanthocheilonema viteae TaxID=6277 RepID=A0A498S5Z4_ACAVI|nr:unnamed protein product [Acanthocheilonema viteae]